VSSEREFGPGDWAIVALLAEHPAHGWALAEKLKQNGEIGSVWSVARPTIYRALDTLKEEGFIETERLEQSERGPYREVYRTTSKGHAALKAWLKEPVPRLADVRSIFLLKLVLASRAGIDRKPMVRAQREVVAHHAEELEARPAPASDAEQLQLRFRLDATHAVLHFLDDLLEDRLLPEPSATAAAPTP
jgi:DNA-binding PadR family transcriptional regulator